MDVFYTIVLSIATVILILILTYIGIQMSNKNTSAATFPPIANTCPDYWKVAVDGKSCEIPTSGKNSVTLTATQVPAGYSATPAPQIDFTNSGWSAGGKSALCSQKDWADSNKIVWDGVTNYNKC